MGAMAAAAWTARVPQVDAAAAVHAATSLLARSALGDALSIITLTVCPVRCSWHAAAWAMLAPAP
eukprot:12794242-Prorocentrum_lima.AAC.1